MSKSARLKLAIIYTDLGLGGIQRKIVDIVNFINASPLAGRVETEIILRWQTDFNLLPNFHPPFDKIFYPPRIFPFPRRRMPYIFNIFRRLVLNRPDVILTHVFGSSLRSIPLARLLYGHTVKIIISQDNIFSMENPEWYARLLAPIIYPMADTIIVQTRVSKHDLVSRYRIPAEKIKVIPNWSRPIACKTTIRDIDMLYVGRFEAQKNLKRLLRICKALAVKKPDLRVMLIGSGRQEMMLKEYVAQQKLQRIVTFAPPQHDVEKYLCRAKIFALTSCFEGQPMALLEAMRCGCVPIITHFPGSDEYIVHNQSGLVAKNNEEFQQYVLTSLADSQQSRALAMGAKTMVKKYYSDKNIQKYVDLLTSSVSGRSLM